MVHYWLVRGGRILPVVGLVLLIFCTCAESDNQSVHNINSDIEISSLLIYKSSAPTVSAVWFSSSYVKRPIISNVSSESAEPGQIIDGILDISASEAANHVLILSCNASCPIQWRFYPAKDELVNTFSALDVMVLEREGVPNTPQNRYLAHLTIYSSSNEMTGKYVCECVSNQDIEMQQKDEVYVFWEELYKPALVNAGKVIHKNLDDMPLGWIDLPCGTANRKHQVYLFTQSLQNFNLGRKSFYMRMLPNASIVQDQFSGFKLNMAELPGAFESVWICTSALRLTGAAIEQAETVQIMLSRTNYGKQLNQKKPSETEMISKIVKNGEKPRTAACCRQACQNCTSTNMPKVKIYPVSNAATAALFKPLLHRSRTLQVSKVTKIVASCASPTQSNFSCDCSTVEIPDEVKIGFILECSGDTTVPLTQEYYFSISDILQIRDYSEIEKKNSSSMMENVALEVVTQHSIRTLLGGMYRMYNESNFYQNSFGRFHEVKTWTYKMDPKNGSYTNTTKINQILGDGLPSDTPTDRICAEGEHRCFFCEMSRFHFAMGPRWTIDWVNGTSTMDIRHTAELDDDDSRIGGAVPPRITTAFCAVMVLQIKTVSCHAPYLDSSNWKTLSLKPPKILPTEIPTVHGIFGGSDFIGDATELQCNISSMSPVKVQWYAGDKIMQESIEPTGSCLLGSCKIVVSILKIRKSENVNCSYTCSATNFKGTDSKTFYHVPRDVVAPRIFGDSEEMFEFYVGDVNRALNCTVSGEPRPNQIYWNKDFSPTKLQQNEFNDNVNETDSSTSTYTIPEVGLNSAGLYKCIAMNRFRDQTHKTFYVKVSKSPVTRNIIVSSVTFLILIGIIFCVLLRKYKRENKDLIKFEKQFRLGIQYDSNSKVEDDGQIRPLSLPYIQDFEIERGEWKKEQCIGGGEFGEVWWGTLRRFQSMHVSERVAIKFLKPDGQQIPLLKVLCSELKMMMRIKQLGSDPNIVNFVGATTKNFQKMEVYLIMELCCLGALKSYVAKNRDNLLVTQDLETIVRPEVAKWSSEIASGMLFLGKHKIVHIDLAARNIFLTSDKVAKVGDYGLSRNLYGKEFYKQKSPFRPELWTALEGLRDSIYTVQSDVWSYGVTIWEVFSMGSDPAYSQVDTVVALEQGERLEKPPFATEETYEILRSCWEAAAESRPNFSTLLNYFKILQAELDVRFDEMSRVAIIEEPTLNPTPATEANAELTDVGNRMLKQNPTLEVNTGLTETVSQPTSPASKTNPGLPERKLNPYESNVPVVAMPSVLNPNPEIPAREVRHYVKSEETQDLPKINRTPVVTILISDPKDQSSQQIVDDPGRANHYQSSAFINAPESWLTH